MLPVNHVDKKHDQLDEPASFPINYNKCKEGFDIVNFANSNLHWKVKGTKVGHYGDLQKSLFKWNSNNKEYIQSNQIKAQQLVQLRWLQFFYQDLHDIKEFNDYVKGKLKQQGVKL